MTTLSVSDSRETVAEHLSTLREYAQRVLEKGEVLTESEEADKAHRMREMLSIGTSFKLTENEMVGLVLKDVHTRKPRCGCPICRERAARNG